MSEETEEQAAETAGTAKTKPKAKPSVSCQIDEELEARIMAAKEKKEAEVGFRISKSQAVDAILKAGCKTLGV